MDMVNSKALESSLENVRSTFPIGSVKSSNGEGPDSIQSAVFVWYPTRNANVVYESVAVYLRPDRVFMWAPMPVSSLEEASVVKIREFRNPAHVWRRDDFEGL